MYYYALLFPFSDKSVVESVVDFFSDVVPQVCKMDNESIWFYDDYY